MSACVAAHRVWFRSSKSCDGHCSSLSAKSTGTFGPVPAGHCRFSGITSIYDTYSALSTLQSPSRPCCACHASASVRVTERGPASPHMGVGNLCRDTSGAYHLAICPEPMRTAEISAAGQATCQVDLCWSSRLPARDPAYRPTHPVAWSSGLDAKVSAPTAILTGRGDLRYRPLRRRRCPRSRRPPRRSAWPASRSPEMPLLPGLGSSRFAGTEDGRDTRFFGPPHRAGHDRPLSGWATRPDALVFRVRRPGQRVARPRDPTGGLWGPAVV